MKNFDLEKNGAEFISRNENSKKVLVNPSNKKNYTCNVTFYCMVHRGRRGGLRFLPPHQNFGPCTGPADVAFIFELGRHVPKVQQSSPRPCLFFLEKTQKNCQVCQT